MMMLYPKALSNTHRRCKQRDATNLRALGIMNEQSTLQAPLLAAYNKISVRVA